MCGAQLAASATASETKELRVGAYLRRIKDLRRNDKFKIKKKNFSWEERKEREDSKRIEKGNEMLEYYNILWGYFLSHTFPKWAYLKLLAFWTPVGSISLGHEEGWFLHETTMEEKLTTGFLLTLASIFKWMHTQICSDSCKERINNEVDPEKDVVS